MPPKDKKEKPKEKPASGDFDLVEGFIILLFLTAIIGSIIPTIWNYITSEELSFFGFKLFGLIDFFKSNIQFFRALGFVAAGVAMVGTFIFNKKSDHIWAAEKARLYPDNMKEISSDIQSEESKQKSRWQKIIELSESQNSSDWRLAVIEADIMLDELLEKLQLPGETMGEKLQAVEKSDFTTIESAWEAHKARNMIAHEGSDFLINQREIRRIISLYEAVFKEFFLI